jgi:hypothetical protein
VLEQVKQSLEQHGAAAHMQSLDNHKVVYAAKDKSLDALKKCFGITKVLEY